MRQPAEVPTEQWRGKGHVFSFGHVKVVGYCRSGVREEKEKHQVICYCPACLVDACRMSEESRLIKTEVCRRQRNCVRATHSNTRQNSSSRRKKERKGWPGRKQRAEDATRLDNWLKKKWVHSALCQQFVMVVMVSRCRGPVLD